MTEKVVWHVVKQYAGILGVSKSHHTIFGARVLVNHSAGGDLEQIQFLLGMFQCRPLKSISVANSDSEKLSMTRSGLSRAHETWS